MKKGDLLFTIDPRPLQAALDQAVGTLAKDKSQLANARALAARYKKLFDEGIASKEDWDQYRTSADTSAGLVAADEAAVENARVQLSYATIRSPISGMTGQPPRLRGEPREGERHDAARHDHAGDADLRDVRRARGRARARSTARAPPDPSASRPRSRATRRTRSRASSRSWTTPSTSTTGTIRLKATFDNAERRLWPGQFVKVTRHDGRRGERPRRAVAGRPDGPGRPVRLRREGRPDRRAAAREARPVGGGRRRDREGPRGGRARRHGRPAAPLPGREGGVEAEIKAEPKTRG